MNFVSAEALVDSCEDIGMVFHLNDGKSTLEPLNGPPLSAIGSDLEGVNVTDSQARYLTRRKFAPRERNMNHFINSMPASEIFLQLTSSEKLFSNSSTSQVNLPRGIVVYFFFLASLFTKKYCLLKNIP